MIALIVVLAFAVGGIIWLRAAWIRLDETERVQHEQHQHVLTLIEGVRVELLDKLVLVARDAAHMRQTHNGDYADLLQQLIDLREIEAGIVAYLDDVPQNFAFHKAGVNYTLRLPERLRLVLTRER